MDADEDSVDSDRGGSGQKQKAEATVKDKDGENNSEGDARVVAWERVVSRVMNEQQGRAGMIHEGAIVEPEIAEENIDE